MDFSFAIPCNNKDLLNTRGDKYYVKQVYDCREIPEQLRICKTAVLTGDPFYLFDHFDTFFSVIENSKNLSPIQLLRAYDLLYLTVDKLGQKLAAALTAQQNGLNGKNINSFLNLTKMSMYLIIGTVKCLDIIVQQSQSAQIKKGKKANIIEAFEGQDWEKRRFNFLVQLFNILQLDLEKLWDPPVAEETFVNLICDICYRTLEIYSNRERHVSDTVFQILGTAIKRYNHALVFPVRILQILRNCEDASMPTAKGILLLHEEYGINSVFAVLIKDIIQSVSVDAGDTQVSRCYSTFLAELGNIAPKLMIPHLSELGDELLNCESHILRNCILQLMGDVVLGELTSEELSEDMKDIRDEFLDILLLHINDISAHVRSKVLQIWNHMKEENGVPLVFQEKVLTGGVERLQDRTSTVRKSAVILIKSFLETNPFAAKLSLAELMKRHEQELEKLESLKDKLSEENKKIAQYEKEWEDTISVLFPIIEEILSDKDKTIPDSQENYEDMVTKISSLLIDKKYRQAVILAQQADHVAGNSDWLALKFDEQCAYYLALLKSYMLLSHGISNKINEEFDTQHQTVKFLEDSIKFSKIITEAIPKIQEMLMSKTNTDVFESVDFFTTAYLFGIKESEFGMRRMLYLVWSGDKEKRDAVANAYKRILFKTDLTGRAHAIKVVDNLSVLFEDLTYGHYTALEGLFKEWVETNIIDVLMIQVMFERFTLKLEGTTENQSRLALQLLIVASNSKSTIATANTAIIEQICFGERALKDPRIYVSCISFLLNAVPTELRSKYYKRYDQDHEIISKVLDIFKTYFFNAELEDFDSVAMKTVEFFYTLCQAPDIICQNLIINTHKEMKTYVNQSVENTTDEIIDPSPISQESTENQDEITQPAQTETQPTETEIQPTETEIQPTQTETQPTQTETQPTQTKTTTSSNDLLPVFLISRFLFLIGYITMKEMIFLDIDVYNNMKFRQELKDESNLKQKKNSKNNKRKTMNMDLTSASESLKRLSGTTAEPQQEPDEDIVGATAEDSIAELINHVCENDLLFAENGLLTHIVPIVIDICKQPSKYQNDELQQAATLTLIRFMAVSSKFCEKQMPFLINILDKTNNIKIKCNIVIGLSDLTFRFPNVIEPWTSHFYCALHQSNVELRLTAMKMLSHLILHEMIRVKAQIAEMAMCIVDENDEIKNITKQFFKEIANKSNILYNILPDIISKLSDTTYVEEEKYRIIMRYILSLIQKDRQVESLVEKLCIRFNVTKEERQWRDIAFCLSLLNYTEKTIKKLTDNIQYFKDKVQVDEVYQSFKSIISNTNKLAKQELKQAVTEFEIRLNECLEVNDENGENVIPTTKPPKSSKKQYPPKKGNRQRTRKKQASSSENESNVSYSNSDDNLKFKNQMLKNKNQQKLNNRTARNQKTTSKVIMESSGSDDDDDEVPQSKKGRSRK